ncbi:uncharacterized protein LOC107040137 [Diachasma alloeum]|uniref:uncharacterized protein LOC107040137 n=1 Tax=Diachasma alloeum TaxID=454923 RepID=UPI0007382F42|nr:uncharacterized protein LOC107040137 [Diachasma alloeum]
MLPMEVLAEERTSLYWRRKAELLSPEELATEERHGCFRAYLHKFKHEDSAECPHCAGEFEDADHVFFKCPRFDEARNEWEYQLGRKVLPEVLTEAMLSSQAAWEATSNFATQVLKELRDEERKRKAAYSENFGTS